MERCRTCKHFSALIVVPSGIGDCLYCQKNHCIYCNHYGRYCRDYEQGENDGGKLADDYDDEDEEAVG